MRSNLRPFFVFIAGFAAIVCAGRSAHAQTITVTTNANTGPGSLREALASAVTGTRITFDPSLAGALINLVTPDPRTLVGGSPLIPFGPTALVVSGIRVTIDGSNAPGLRIDGATTWRVFVVVNGAHLTLTNVTVQNGRAIGNAGGPRGGGGSGGFGGGVFVADGSRLSLDGVTMLQHHARGGAGAGGATGGSSGGGGGGLIGPGEAWRSTDFSGAGGAPNGGAGSATAGASGGEGGGGSGGTTYFETTREFQYLTGGGNGGWGGGGGGGSSASTSPISRSWTVARWDPGGLGGFGGGGGGTGAAPSGGTTFPVPPRSTSLWGGGRGGGTAPSSGGGGGAGLGGAIFARNATVDIVRSTFLANASISGVAGSSDAGAAAGLGAVFLLNSTSNVRNSTFADNHGGAVFVLSYESGSASVTMQNTVIAGNFQGCGVSGLAASFSSAGNNHIELNGSLMASPCPLSSSDRVGIAPALGPLAANGGPTPTMLPSASSPLLGRGDCAMGDVDQRGRPRAVGPGCDIGAVEVDRATVRVVLAGAGTGRVASDVLGIDCGSSCSTARTPVPVALTLTATAAAGSVFTGFTGGGCTTATNCRVTTSADTTITATFGLDPDAGLTDSGASDASIDAEDAAGADASDASIEASLSDGGGASDASAISDSAMDLDTLAADDARIETDAPSGADRPADLDDGPGAPDGPSNDGAITTRDATPDAGSQVRSAGCGCRTAGLSQSGRNASIFAALVLALASRARRRRS